MIFHGLKTNDAGSRALEQEWLPRQWGEALKRRSLPFVSQRQLGGGSSYQGVRDPQHRVEPAEANACQSWWGLHNCAVCYWNLSAMTTAVLPRRSREVRPHQGHAAPAGIGAGGRAQRPAVVIRDRRYGLRVRLEPWAVACDVLFS